VREALVSAGNAWRYLSRFPQNSPGPAGSGIAIARAIALSPNSSCSTNRHRRSTFPSRPVIDLLRSAGRARLVVLFISHDLKVVRALCHASSHAAGKIVEQGPVDEFSTIPKPLTRNARQGASSSLIAYAETVMARNPDRFLELAPPFL